MSGDRSELRRLLGGDTGEKLARPTPVRSRGGQLRRDPAGEWDWFYLLDAGLQAWIRRNCMSATGLAPDDMADLAGDGDIETWAAAFGQACQVARDRSAADDWAGDYAADDDAELYGPDEFAELLGVERATLRQWRHRDLLPRESFILSSLPIWTLGDIRQWAADTGRTIETEQAS